MFCTGGIRCEKASSFMLQEGFEEVYHLKGGILKYLEEVKPDESMWNGECFVFDGRVSVDHHLAKGCHDMCFGCGNPITEETKLSKKYERGVSCPNCFDAQSEKTRARVRERQKQLDLSKARSKKKMIDVVFK